MSNYDGSRVMSNHNDPCLKDEWLISNPTLWNTFSLNDEQLKLIKLFRSWLGSSYQQYWILPKIIVNNKYNFCFIFKNLSGPEKGRGFMYMKKKE